MNDAVIIMEKLVKEYRLGVLGSGSLYGDLQSWYARVRGKEDPNRKIGHPEHNEHFIALSDINVEVRQGDTLGIIGANGAGKSTLLKILSRVTAPTSGEVRIRGRIASLLEVGTGFHPELTGRENVYLNGAILGMTREEVSRKFDQIVEFSEVGQFIDTPVKRYSSGMYVKLAFAVAAHLDPDILVVDEVLAVGDMKFQQKCLGKMSDVAGEGRTVLYVSHNMNTILQLCNRAIVLDKGKVRYDGTVEEAIRIYMDNDRLSQKFIDFQDSRKAWFLNRYATFESLELLGKESFSFRDEEEMRIRIHWKAHRNLDHLGIRMEISYSDGSLVGMAAGPPLSAITAGSDVYTTLAFDCSNLASGMYVAGLDLYQVSENGAFSSCDHIYQAFFFETLHRQDSTNLEWHHSWWGHVKLNELNVMDEVILHPKEQVAAVLDSVE